ncbi:hypothetical protein [Sphingomonas sp. Y38-1Y]|uniref:hypothetical protein n=1 Tax=Sphingomonas sp. Y38-1Y TaxID=3078265 RepID=UPI0028E24F69|nr:hypothetical protein [Sphingomonas sp. Y38-1Y]
MPNRFFERAALGLVLALAIGLAVVAICNTVAAMATGMPLTTGWGDQSVIQIILAGLPYLVLAAVGIRARRAWITALALTAAFWGFYLWDLTVTDAPDANIGLGIMMMASPVAIIAGALLASAAGRRSR